MNAMDIVKLILAVGFSGLILSIGIAVVIAALKKDWNKEDDL